MSSSPEDESRGFDLGVPTGDLANANPGDRPAPHQSNTVHRKVASDSSQAYKSMGWKGIDDDDEDDDDPPVSFSNKEPIPEDELDMTPMVDVTFLLLIFFMVTASFTLQKSLQQPPAASDDASTNVAEPDEVEDYVEVIIDQNNSFYVTSKGESEIEAPSEIEMRRLVKDAVEAFSPTRLVVTAHVDATMDRQIAACDAGQSSNLIIEVKTTDVEY